ncbi:MULTISPECIES: TIGR02530 family flagellar biosynthesis protein [Niallia]|uniref:Flagellar protein n=1 Tax=Niallia alba TaxID=2729105 RepID=A0A7Y0K7U7_9BACI|nr:MULTISPECIES: TIGR02530 family flagellar biosynthesis protein [Niallia]NMO77350.1 flagellar protein [Niallia alba]UTI40558.1 flagellar protein [Niallia sp. RD1]
MDKPIYPSIKSHDAIKNGIEAIKSKSNAHNTQNKITSFSSHLHQSISSLNTLNISKHANERLQQRGIEIDADKWKAIEEKVTQAKKMGIKESLVLLNNAALIVSAKNNTVITAMDLEEATDQIFTNINGTIIMN